MFDASLDRGRTSEECLLQLRLQLRECGAMGVFTGGEYT